MDKIILISSSTVLLISWEIYLFFIVYRLFCYKNEIFIFFCQKDSLEIFDSKNFSRLT